MQFISYNNLFLLMHILPCSVVVVGGVPVTKSNLITDVVVVVTKEIVDL